MRPDYIRRHEFFDAHSQVAEFRESDPFRAGMVFPGMDRAGDEPLHHPFHTLQASGHVARGAHG